MKGAGVDERETGQLDSWRNYAGEARELPDLPFLMMVPPTSVKQVALECRQFLQPGSFEIVEIAGAMEQQSDTRGEADFMRIYIVATTVSEFTR